jgi:hypothetical protein
MDADGDAVVPWASWARTPGTYGVYARRYDESE